MQARDRYTSINDHLLVGRQADSDRSPQASPPVGPSRRRPWWEASAGGAACGAKEMRTVWKRDGILQGEVQVADEGTVLLTYEKQGDPRTAEINGEKLGPEFIILDNTTKEDPKRFSETLRVTRNGLEP